MSIEIGWLPNSEMLEGLVQLDEKKEVIVDINGCTSTPGIFAAGDITNAKSKQIIIAAGDGARQRSRRSIPGEAVRGKPPGFFFRPRNFSVLPGAKWTAGIPAR